MIATLQPVHTWLHVHIEFVLGTVIGSASELALIFASRWLYDSYLWLKWFSQ